MPAVKRRLAVVSPSLSFAIAAVVLLTFGAAAWAGSPSNAASAPPTAAAAHRFSCGTARNPSYFPPRFLHATHIVGRGFACARLREAALTYLGAPRGCVRSRRCTQSGVGSANPSGIDCARRAARVSCRVLIGSRHGSEAFRLTGRGDGLNFPDGSGRAHPKRHSSPGCATKFFGENVRLRLTGAVGCRSAHSVLRKYERASYHGQGNSRYAVVSGFGCDFARPVQAPLYVECYRSRPRASIKGYSK